MDTTTMVFLAIGLAAVLVAIGLVVMRRHGSAEEEVQYCRCSSCGQKMRYQASRQGQLAKCPRCGNKSILADRPKGSGQVTLRVGQKIQTPVPMTRS